MIKCNIKLTTINDVKDFVEIISRYDFEIDLSSGRYIVDAKSIMGIFSLDLTKEIQLKADTDETDILDKLSPFIKKAV